MLKPFRKNIVFLVFEIIHEKFFKFAYFLGRTRFR